MAVTQITAGQKDWLSTLNSDLSQIGDKVSSSTVPITAITAVASLGLPLYIKLATTTWQSQPECFDRISVKRKQQVD